MTLTAPERTLVVIHPTTNENCVDLARMRVQTLTYRYDTRVWRR